MDSHTPASSSAQGRTKRNAATRPGGVPSMYPRQAEAYLLARDALRRIRRTSALVSALSGPAPAGGRTSVS